MDRATGPRQSLPQIKGGCDINGAVPDRFRQGPNVRDKIRRDDVVVPRRVMRRNLIPEQIIRLIRLRKHAREHSEHLNVPCSAKVSHSISTRKKKAIVSSCPCDNAERRQKEARNVQRVNNLPAKGILGPRVLAAGLRFLHQHGRHVPYLHEIGPPSRPRCLGILKAYFR